MSEPVNEFEQHCENCEICKKAAVPQDLCPMGQELY